jgi:hypothetical protein
MIAEIIYAVCALTSSACAWLLLRAYARSRVRLLFWSGLAFVGLALNNILLYVDILILPATDLSAWRLIPAAVGLALLCYGLVWEAV